MRNIELELLQEIQEYLRTPWGDRIFPWITGLGDGGALWILLGLLLLFFRKHRTTGVFVMAALAVEFLLCNVIVKNAVGALRPFQLDPSVNLLIPAPEDYSFPSGHTGASFAAVTALYLGKERYWYLALIPAALIAFSRLYLYVHFPADILGGIALGILSGWMACKLCGIWLSSEKRKRNQ